MSRSAKPATRRLIFGLFCLVGLSSLWIWQEREQRQQRDFAEFLRTAQLGVLQTYLDSLPERCPENLHDLTGDLSPAVMEELMIWLPKPPVDRPMLLQVTGMAEDHPVFVMLLKASLIGSGAPSTDLGWLSLERLLPGFTLATQHDLMQSLAAKAATEPSTAAEPALSIALARHPHSGWTQVESAVSVALQVGRPFPALDLLLDWQDDPPDNIDVDPSTIHFLLAQLYLATDQLGPASQSIQTALQSDLSEEGLVVAWEVAQKKGELHGLIPFIESWLQQYPQHVMHWRELEDGAKAAPEYLHWMKRLAQACEHGRQNTRLCEILFHMAWLEDTSHLLKALPLARSLGRLAEAQALVRKLEDRPDTNAATLVNRLAELALKSGDLITARDLLAARPQGTSDLETLTLATRIECAPLSPMEAVMRWRRHLQRYPEDVQGRHQLLEAWLAAGQTHAAIQELLRTQPDQLSPELRVRTAQLALAARHTRSFETALQRLVDAADPLPSPVAEQLGTAARVLGQEKLADQLTQLTQSL